MLGYEGTAAWNAYAMGVGIVVFALIAAYMPKAWEEIINIAPRRLARRFAFRARFFGGDRSRAAHGGGRHTRDRFRDLGDVQRQSFYKRWRSGHTV